MAGRGSVNPRHAKAADSFGQDLATPGHGLWRFAHPHRGLPIRVIVLCLGQLGNVERGVAECDQLAPGSLMFEEPLIRRQRPVSLFFHVLRNEGVELFASGTILFVLEVPRQFASYYFHQVLWRFSLREPTRVIPQLKCIPQINMIA